LKLVLEVTDDKKLPKHVRKQLQIETAPHKSPQAKLLKMADKISNIREIGDSPPRDWSLARRLEYFDWSEKVVAGLRGVNAALENLYDESLAAGRKKMMGNRG
jgi:GTP diphosphokinase / guanosine-3',5'-bis(diphosphate) 3'-diphosphatase